MMHHSANVALLSLAPVLRSACFRTLEDIMRIIMRIIKYAPIALVFLLDVPIDVSTCIFISLILVEDKPYNGTFKTSTWYDMFRMTVHFFLIIFFFPLFFSLSISFMYSVCIYLVLSFLEHIPKGCIFLRHEDGEHRKTKLPYHDISAFAGYLTAKYIFGFLTDGIILFTLANVIIHISFISTVCNTLMGTIVNFYLFVKTDIVIRTAFVSKFGKFKISCYMFVMLLKLLCFTAVFPLLFYLFSQELLLLYGPTRGVQTIDLLNTDTFSNVSNTADRKTYSYPLPDKAEIYIQTESFTENAKSVFLGHFQDCKFKKAILNENVLLSVKTDRGYSDRNSFYFWRVDGKPITEIEFRYKYDSFINESGKKRQYMLFIRYINTHDFGTYSLTKQTCFSISYCSNSVIPVNHENIVNYTTCVTKTIACRFLLQSSENLKINGTVGEMVKVSNIRRILDANQNLIVPMVSVTLTDILIQCQCNPLIGLFAEKGYTKEIRPITDSWSQIILNISFCICPYIYTFDSASVYVYIANYNVILANIDISVEPLPTDLFKEEYANEFMQCEKLGYTLETFYVCLTRASNPLTIFQDVTLQQFVRETFAELLLILVSTAVVTYSHAYVNKSLDRLLFNIFHHERDNNKRRLSFPQTEYEFDVYLSYNDESTDDKHFVEETIKPILKESSEYRICDCENIIPGQNRRRGFEVNIMKSKTLITLLSTEYLNNDICMQLEYEYTLLSLLGAAKLSRDNILIIKMDTCPQDAPPLKQFTVIDWSDSVINLRTESKKKKELQEWLDKQFRKPGKLKMFKLFILNRIVLPVLRRVIDTEHLE